MRKILLITLIILSVLGCKTKKTASISEEVYVPERDDYIMAASYSYILICDSASRKTSKQIMDSGYTINYGETGNAIFKLNESLGNQGYNKRMKSQIQEILANVLGELTPTTASYMNVQKDDFPDDFLRRNILVSRFLEPNFDNLNAYVVKQLQEKWQTAVSYRLWTDANMLYNQYYNSNKKIEIDFNNISQKAIDQYIENAKKYEPLVKNNYPNWNDKRAASIMATIKK